MVGWNPFQVRPMAISAQVRTFPHSRNVCTFTLESYRLWRINPFFPRLYSVSTAIETHESYHEHLVEGVENG